jgi:5'-3' exonuclease
MGEKEVIEKLGVAPKHIPMLKALAGDASDNIRGIRGIGNKTAAKILDESNHNWDLVLQHKKIRPDADVATENLELTKSVMVSSVFTLNELELGLGFGTYQQVDNVFDRYHFGSFVKRRAKILKTLNINDSRK